MPILRTYDLSNVTPQDLAYIAGFLDGDGCFYIGVVNTKTIYGNKHKNFTTCLKFSNNDLVPLEWIKNKVGGTIEIIKGKMDKHRNFPCYSLWIGGNLLTDLTELLIPFLQSRKKQAEIMLQMRKTYSRTGSRGPTKPSKEIHELRCSLCIQMHQANSRFRSNPIKLLAPCNPPDLCSEDVQDIQG